MSIALTAPFNGSRSRVMEHPRSADMGRSGKSDLAIDDALLRETRIRALGQGESATELVRNYLTVRSWQQ